MRAERSPRNRTIFRTPQRRAVFWLFLVTVAVILLGSLIVLDNSRVTIDRQAVTLPALPASAEGFSILLISDVHGKEFGEAQSRIFAALDQTRVDAIVFAGDLCAADGDPSAFYAVIDGLAAHSVTSKKPVFFLGGDEDPPTAGIQGIEWVISDWVQGAMDRGAVLLDSPQQVRVGNGSVWFLHGHQPIIDVDDPIAALTEERDQLRLKRDTTKIEIEQRISTISFNLKVLARIKEMRGLIQTNDVQVGVLHQPLTEAFSSVLSEMSDQERADFRAMDVILSGHYCGGGIRLPVLGALHIPAPTLQHEGWWPQQELTRGQAEVCGIIQVVTPGLGISKQQKPMRMRVMNTPSITIVRLTGG